MKAALLTGDAPTGAVLQALLRRTGIDAEVFRISPSSADGAVTAERIDALREAFSQILVVARNQTEAPAGSRAINLVPSLEAWLTRDAATNLAVLGTAEIPPPEEARAWLAHMVRPGNRRFSLGLDGRALAARLDLGLLAAFSPDFRSLMSALRPAWASEQPMRRGRGRPAGIAMFRGTGYAMCLELLHLGERAEVTPAMLGETLHRTKTPILRLIQEGTRRGYLQRSSARGPLRVRNTERLLEDMVTDAKARRAERLPATLSLDADRDPQSLPARLSRRLAEHGRVLALTGAPAVAEHGGDLLIGGPIVAYTNLAGIDAMLGDAFIDERNPRLLLIEPREEGMLHRLQPGTPARVSPWQAAIDLLSSVNEREREVGTEVKHRLLDGGHRA